MISPALLCLFKVPAFPSNHRLLNNTGYPEGMDNPLIKAPIPSLIRKIAIPASIGFFFNTMFNVVDTYYAGLVSVDAIAALSLSFPIFFIILAIGTGISTGATALIANSLGAGDKKKAMLYAMQAVTASVIVALVLTGVGILISPMLFVLLGASGEYLTLSLGYIEVIFYGSIFFMLNYIFNGILSATGDTKTFRNFLIVGFFLNLILDPLFMFGWLGFPALGVAGVAWATIAIQALGSVYMGWKATSTPLFCKGCKDLWVPRYEPQKEMAKQGFPASLNMMAMALGIFIITYFISDFSQAGVAAYGIGTRMEQIILLPTIGLNIAVLTLVAQNNGAGRMDRVKETIRTSLKFGAMVMLPASIILFLLSPYLMALFTGDPEVINIGTTYLRFASTLTVAYVTLYTTVSSLQGLKRPMMVLVIGLSRQIILPILVILILTRVFDLGLIGIWLGIVICVWSAAIFSYWYMMRTLHTLES